MTFALVSGKFNIIRSYICVILKENKIGTKTPTQRTTLRDRHSMSHWLQRKRIRRTSYWTNSIKKQKCFTLLFSVY